MIKKLFSKIIDIDKPILKLMKNILKVALLICITACLILCMYIYNGTPHTTYLAGLSIFRSGLMIAVFGIICGISIDWLKK